MSAEPPWPAGEPGKRFAGNGGVWYTLAAMDDERWMREALAEARLAAEAGEIPVGAVVVWQERVIGRGHNAREGLQDPTAHAEILALREAARARARGGWRLAGATLYCTLEPCAMCAGALVNARVERLVFAVRDPKAGAAGSVFDVVRSPWLNHRLQVTAGVLQGEAQRVMEGFFQGLRTRDAETGRPGDAGNE